MKDTRSLFLTKTDELKRIYIRNFLSKKNLLVSEYPKSGGSWLSNLLCDTLFPKYEYPRNTGPKSLSNNILHGHFLFKKNFSNYILLVRDCRDVMISAYYHFLFPNSRNQDRLYKKVRNKLSFNDYDDIQNNLPDFINFMHYVYAKKPFHFNWSEMVNSYHKNQKKIILVKYEDLKNDPEYELKKIFNILNLKYDLDKLKSAIIKNDFKNITNRVPGHQDLNSFARKGVVGDWKNHFNEKSVEITKKLYGEELIYLNYEKDKSWNNYIKK